MDGDVLVIGGLGEVGGRVTALLEAALPGRVIVAGRHASSDGRRSRILDLGREETIEPALRGVSLVIACVRQPRPYLLQAAVRRGLGYTSIAPPWLSWEELQPLHAEAQRTGARIVLATGIEPGISSVLARVASDQLGRVESVRTALLLSVGDQYGDDSLAFLFEELGQEYTIQADGEPEHAMAFGRTRQVEFHAPAGRRRVYTIPFRDQLYYPRTLGARTASAWIAIEPAWLGAAIAVSSRLGARRLTTREGGRARLHALTTKLRRRYAGRDRFALLVEASDGERVVRHGLVGRQHAQATAVAAAATAEALYRDEVKSAGVWLPEQVIDAEPFLVRLRKAGYVPELGSPSPEAPAAARPQETT